MSVVEVPVPDIGEFDQVDVIEVLVAAGDRVEADQSLITLESDKATMEIPSPEAGVVRSLRVEIGSQVSEGDVILELEVTREAVVADPAARELETAQPESGSSAAAAPVEQTELPDADLQTEVLVLGSGPGGYTAAFRAADLGKKVVLVERHPDLGGVCLNVGCIPSKALLHLSEIIIEAKEMSRHGVHFGAPTLELDGIRGFKDSVVKKLTSGLSALAKRRDVTVLRGTGRFEGPHLMRVESEAGSQTVSFEQAVVAVGSRPVEIADFPNHDPHLMNSTQALQLDGIPGRLLVIGGGIIGLELASVFHALGSQVTVVELLDQLMAGADPDLVKPLKKIIEKRYENIYLSTRVTRIEASDAGMQVSFEGSNVPDSEVFDRVLVAVGRRPNGDRIDAEKAGLEVDERGFIRVDDQCRSNVPHIFAIGDVVGEPMLAHKATHEGKTAAEVIAGHKAAFEPAAIPSVAYTDPEVAWMGLTESQAKQQGIEIRKASFPWAASGRALGIGRSEGHTKLILDPETGKLLGAGITGPHAGDLISELVLALELGADSEDLALTIHPHPTLSESIGLAAEMAEGTITDLYLPRRR